MADELRIKIILDDGSVKEGFVSAEKQAEKSAQKIGKSFDKKGSGLQSVADGAEAAAGGITSMAQAAIRAAGPVGAIVAAIGAAALGYAKMALAGEQVNAVNTQFTNIATSAGLAADSFKESIIGATQGLIDDEDALQIATKGIVALGDQASKLPAILDASRSVSRGLGKDFKSTFEDLSSFVENGNARVLRQYGIVLDLDKAYEKAAKSIGLTASALTEQQKQQVRANLILDEVPKKFDAASQSVTPLKDAFDRLKVSATNSLESIQSALAEFVTRKFIDNSDLSNVALSRLNTRLKETESTITNVSARIAEIKLDKLGSKSVQAASEISSLNAELKRLRQEQFLVQQAINDQKEIERKTQQSRKATPQTDDEIKATAEQRALARQEQLKRLNDLQAYVSAQDKLVVDSEIKRLQTITNIDQKLTAQRSLAEQQSILLEQQKNAALSQVNEQFSVQKGFSEEQRLVAENATKASFYQQEQALAQENADKIKAIEENKNFSIQTGFQNFASGYSAAVLEFQNNVAANFKEVGKQAFNTLGRGVGQAFAAFGQALASGEDAGKAFLQSLIGIFADIAIQLGTSYILQGIAASANPFTPGIGAGMITAGAALATFGGVLKGLSGGKSQTSASADTGGGIASSPSTSTDLTPTQDLQRAEATTGVSVVIQGDVLDSDESGSRIVNLINSAFDKKGVVINQGVMA